LLLLALQIIEHTLSFLHFALLLTILNFLFLALALQLLYTRLQFDDLILTFIIDHNLLFLETLLLLDSQLLAVFIEHNQ
jgi:hypothetical protein